MTTFVTPFLSHGATTVLSDQYRVRRDRAGTLSAHYHTVKLWD